MKTIQEPITPSIHQSISFPVLSWQHCFKTEPCLHHHHRVLSFGSVKKFKSQLLSLKAGLVPQAFNDVHRAGDDFPTAALQLLLELGDPVPGRIHQLTYWG